ADPPTTWSETEHIKWKVKVPGAGDSTPIIWADKVFLLTAVPKGKQTQASISERSQPAGGGDVAPERPTPDLAPPGDFGPRGGPGRGPRGRMNAENPTEPYQFVVLCLDRKTGKTLWQKTAREAVPHEGHQPNNTFASATPFRSGQVVLGFFG